MIDLSETAKAERGSAPSPDHIMLSFSQNPHTTATVTWRTDISREGGYMEYMCADGVKHRVESRNKKIKTDTDESIIRWSTAQRLIPGTQ